MAEPQLVSMAEQFTGLPMSDLIGAPLLAAAEANNMMAVTQTRFLLDTAFSIKADETTKAETYSPIIIDMKLTRGVLIPADPTKPDSKATIDQVTTIFSLPLLTILPLNSLAVDNVDITFDMEVKSSYSESTSEATEEKMAAASTFSAKVGFGIFSASVTGSVSYDSAHSTNHDTHYEKSNSAKYGVRVHAGQLPLPQGVTTIIQAFTNSITPITMPTEPPAKTTNSGG
ncbi:DUF2589 domain-containing protein [Nannocystis radixulma]|uniref:DUF2589 domain-containing protein n=1 Tax=Nannocystis radixulma TaxID=2995305 RepID=A0ABT5BNG0_9BACT|nr:DUF2589 domain-containing protein [Nannocystis radixulma]MDC0674527.1 DUF2589 domain-containing protein [Nannocystis radixulma]